VNLLTIEEPKNNKEKNICLGIDFGTTNSVCSVITDEKISFIKDEKNNELIPTLVYYKNGIKKFGNNKVLPKWQEIFLFTLNLFVIHFLN